MSNYEKYRERIKAYSRDYAKKNPDKVRLWRRKCYLKMKDTEKYREMNKKRCRDYYYRYRAAGFDSSWRYTFNELSDLEYEYIISDIELINKIEKEGKINGSKC